MKTNSSFTASHAFPLLALGFAFMSAPARAAELDYTDSHAFGEVPYFGDALGLSGDAILVGAPRKVGGGSIYWFDNLDTATGIITQDTKLHASDRASGDDFGFSASLLGDLGLVGAVFDYVNGTSSGSAHVFRNISSANGATPVLQSVRLLASDPANYANFGRSVSLSGTSGLVGAMGGGTSFSGAAYLFRNLHTVTGTGTPASVTQNLKLWASDKAANDYFGVSVSLSTNGNLGLVGALNRDDKGTDSGAAYVFRNLNSATGTGSPATVTQNLKLWASDGAANNRFGKSVSLSGTLGLVGAAGNQVSKGAAYLFRNLDTVTGTGGTPTAAQDLKLVASDGAAYDYFGYSVSASDSTAIIGAYGHDVAAANDNLGAAYVFFNLDSAVGSGPTPTVTESLKITASDAFDDEFGMTVSIDGDLFAIGRLEAALGRRGSVFIGSVSSLSTLNSGNISKVIDGLSFVSRNDWIIGETTSNNTVTLSSGDAGDVTAPGKFVYIGKLPGSDGNRLIIDGDLTANGVYVGAAGNTGNVLEVNGTLATTEGIFIAAGASFVGNLTLTSGSTIGSGATVDGNLTLEAGAQIVFDPTKTLTVTGTVILDVSFGVDDILGLDSSVELGTYKLIDVTDTDFSLQVSENWGAENAYDLGGGKFAYFQQGSLEMVVTGPPAPEIAVNGKGLDIASGDTTPAAPDNTDFGTASSEGGAIIHTFEISNSGSGNLALTAPAPGHVTINGPGASAFSVTTQPSSSIVPPGGHTEFHHHLRPTGNRHLDGDGGHREQRCG